MNVAELGCFSLIESLRGNKPIYEKGATSASFFVYTRTLQKTKKSIKVCPHFLLISDGYSVEQIKKSMFQNNIYKKSIYYVKFM